MAATVRKLYQRLVAEDVIPRPWNMDEFRRRADAFRGRRVQLIHQPAQFWVDEIGGGCGLYAMTIAAGEVDIMIVRDDGPPAWQQQCIGHEYGHLLLEHQPRGLISDEQIRRLFGDDLFTDPAYIRNLLAHTRADLSVRIEREAEQFGEMLALATSHTADDQGDLARMRYGFAARPRRGRWS